MGVMTFSIIGVAMAVTRYRQQRIIKRLMATPLSPFRFLAAQAVARLILSVVQVAVILGVGVFMFDAHIYGNVLWLFVLATLGNLIFLNIGFAAAGRAASEDAANGIANAIALPMIFLSGVFFSTDMLPEPLQTVVRYLPLTPLIDAMRMIANDGLSITDAGPQVGPLLVWVTGSFLLASRYFRFARA